MKPLSLIRTAIATLLVATLAACSDKQQKETVGPHEDKLTNLQGNIMIDGSSTVYPITEAIAEEFSRKYPHVKVKIGVSGTGGGFKKFIRGEIDINNASRSIRPSEKASLAEAGYEYIELRIGFDGIAVVVHSNNDWMDTTTIAELRHIWQPESEQKVTQWNHIRSNWPAEPLTLYGPGTASGTFDYFTEHVMGEVGRSRGDYIASEDDNQLVIGISGDQYALGYFGMAYYLENQDKLRSIPISDQGAAIPLTPENVRNGSYPLARPLFIYIRKDALQRPEVKAFVQFYLEKATELIPQVGYVPLLDQDYREMQQKIK